jgi:polyhydroxyalkanoate synthesis regulator phasin
MKPTRTSLVAVLAAALLVGATGAALAASREPAAPPAPVPAAATPSPAPAWGGPRVRDDLLAGVLDDLVAKGTITEAQKGAILDGVAAERSARQEERKAAREQAKADRQQLKEFLADGVITKAEFDKLPATSPLRTLTTLMDDGKITTDELQELGRGMFPGGKGNGHGWGKGWLKGNGHGWGNGPMQAAPSASPAPGS